LATAQQYLYKTRTIIQNKFDFVNYFLNFFI